ncbi:Acyl-CoA reductase [Pseudonocardia thermophila]|jgi:NAD-dependent aldehyde dehydrogenases|uniref:Aldehyde dehydrogenase n=1 Tax=Pseudonocardia thermophila TaxID=1848 RepID=A0A1M6QFB9_PSETH|nr:aldehyde dehydrogenase family protein [Pseudonocardia thermophila]SHK18743.1 Acyl-CoA reductase [Pseudonocardia thermophila]
MTATDSPVSAAPGTFTSHDPRTGDVVGTYPEHDAAAVEAAVARAAEAAQWWGDLGFAGRAPYLRRWRRELVRRIDTIAEIVRAETGKPLEDAELELVLAIDHLDWATRNAEKVLGRRRVRSGVLMANQAATLAYAPLGVVGVIGPWNYPVFTPMGSVAYALAAGNAVVFKPSELTPGVGIALADSLAEIVEGRTLFQVVTGHGETGAALCRAPGIAKIAFTGSAATGRRVMAACAERLTPVLMECGGKDALIVAPDADLEAAADAAVWGGMSNAGQTCVGVERVYVVEEVAEEFTRRVVAKAERLRAGGDPGAAFGPMTLPAQVDVVRRHVEDALAKGGEAVVGGPESVRAPFVDPVVLVDVPEDSCAVTEETFGPVLVVNTVADVDEAIARANATPYGLGAAVFSKSQGEEIAARLRCGMVAINGVVSFAGIPSLPFGGVGESGFGRIHGADGLREFARPQAVARQRFALPVPVTSFTRTRRGFGLVVGLARLLWGR